MRNFLSCDTAIYMNLKVVSMWPDRVDHACNVHGSTKTLTNKIKTINPGVWVNQKAWLNY